MNHYEVPAVQTAPLPRTLAAARLDSPAPKAGLAIRPEAPARRAWAGPLALILAAWPAPPASAAKTDWAVLVEARAEADPPSITLTWPAEPRATGFEIQRKRRTDPTWGGAIPPAINSPPEAYAGWRRPIAKLPGSATSWTDASVVPGVIYEYEVLQTTTIPLEGQAPANQWPTPVTGRNLWGYIAAGIEVPAPDHRGTVVLVVDETMAGPLEGELGRLRDDLIGDGWSVIRHDVPRGPTDDSYDKDGVARVKRLIVGDYRADPGEVKSVFLLGHVPVPRGGGATFDGHPEHRGAIPTDRFYADMHTDFGDEHVDTRTPFYQGAPPYNKQLENIPGDGKFDQVVLAERSSPEPYDSTLEWKPAHSDNQELEVGRVDLWGLNDFAPATEADLLRRYLDKDHDHRHANRVLPRRALIDGSKLYYAGSMWSSWSGMVGAANVGPGTFKDLVEGGHLGYWIQGAGWNNTIDGSERVTTARIAREDPKAAFWMMYGSHIYDFDYPDNIMRAALATSTGLTNGWSGECQLTMHAMEMGGTAGEMMRLNQNNGIVHLGPWFYLYNHWSEDNGRIHANLLGDPTLRLYAVKPVPSVAAAGGPDGVAVSWTASPDEVAGYHVYRSAEAAGPFARISADPVAGTSFRDGTPPAAGTYTYMVRAIKLERVPTGTYFNPSQGKTAAAAYPGRR